MSSRERIRALTWVVFFAVMALQWACSRDVSDPYAGRVVRFDSVASYEPITIAGTTMTAVTLDDARKTYLKTTVNGVAKGQLLVSFATLANENSPGGQPGTLPAVSPQRGSTKNAASERTKLSPPQQARAKVVFRSLDSGFWFSKPVARSCIATLADSRSWQGCRIDVPREFTAAEITVEMAANDAVPVAMSEIVMTPGSSLHPPVFVLLFDSARLDRFRPFTDVVPIGTNLAHLAKDGIVFTNLRSSSSWTRPAVASLLTGLRSERHRVYGRLDILGSEFLTLGEILQRGGYFTRAWTTNPAILPRWGFAQGFDMFADAGSQNWARSKTDAGEVLDWMEQGLDAAAGVPIAYYLHFMDAHSPYQPPEELRSEVSKFPNLAGTFPGSDVDSLVSEYGDYKLYLGELLDLDRALGRFVDDLRRRGLYDDALILVVSDHGEEFLDHGGTFHGRTLFEEVIRVPAILKLPKFRAAGTIVSSSASIEDLFATSLGALAIEVPSGIDGVDLLAEFEAVSSGSGESSRPQFSVLRLDGKRLESVVDGSWKLIVDRLNQVTSLFDLSSDPRELRDVSAEHSKKAELLAALLDAGRSSTAAGWHFLFCGTEHPVTFSLEITGVVGSPEMFDLEDEDRVELESEADEPRVEIAMELVPYSGRRSDFAAMKEVPVEDRDWIRFPVAQSGGVESLAVRHPRGVPFRFILGKARAVSASRNLDLSALMDRVIVDDGALIECPATGDERRFREGWRPETAAAPFVRIWYVPPTERVAESDVSPDVLDRLRVLGYVE